MAASGRWRNRLASHGLHAGARTGPAWRGIDRYGRRPRAARVITEALVAIVMRRAIAGLWHLDRADEEVSR